MVNSWVEHVRRWSKDNGFSYMCSISKPECKAAYRSPQAAAAKSKMQTELKSKAKPAPVVRVGRTVKMKMPKKPTPVNERIQPLTAGLSTPVPKSPSVQVRNPMAYPKMKPRNFRTALSEID